MNKKALVLILSIFCSIGFVKSQRLSDDISKLEKKLKTETNINQIEIIDSLCRLTFHYNYNTHSHYVNLLEQKASKDNNINHLINAYLYKSFLMDIKQRYDSIDHYTTKAIDLARGKNDSAAALCYISIAANMMINMDEVATSKYLDSAFSILRINDYKYLEAYYLSVKGDYTIKTGDTKKGIEQLKQAIRMFYELEDRYEIPNHIISLGFAYYDLEFLELSIAQAREALIIAKETENRSDEAIAYNLLGNSYFYESLDSTLKYLNLFERICLELDYSEGVLIGLSSKALAYESYNQYEKASEQLQIAEDWKNEHDLPPDEGYLSSLRALNYNKRGMNEKALYHINKAIIEGQPIRQLDLEVSYYYIKSTILRDLGRYSDSEIKGIFDTIRSLFNKTKNTQNLVNLYNFQYSFYRDIENYEEALYNYEKYVHLRDSVQEELTSTNPGVISEITIDNLGQENIELKESVVESQSLISQLRIAIFTGLAIFLIAVLLIFSINSHRIRRRLKQMNENLSSVVEERTKKLNQEIEEKDKIQNHLERTNKEYFQITSSIPAMIWRAHYKTDGKFVLEYVSEFIYVLSSKTIEDQKEDPNYWRNEVVHPEDKELYIEFYDNIMTSNLKEAEFNYRIIDKFNKLRWLNEKVIITYRDKKDGNTGLHGVVTDITVLKEIEEKLIAIQEEQKDLIATKDKFFSIISHDLKNPFNAILGFTNLLEENYDSYSAKDHKKFITNISKAATSSFKLVQNLLDWSRAQSKATEPERKEFDISIVVNQAINTVKPAATNKFIRINTEVPYGIQVIADENMIETVIRNLLSNAVKFSIEHEEIKLYIKEENKFVYLSVEDKGVGIEKEDLDNLFKIDKQVRTKGTKNESGTGLGLLLCHEFMKLNMGDIIVKSEPVKGSTFTLKIPKPTED